MATVVHFVALVIPVLGPRFQLAKSHRPRSFSGFAPALRDSEGLPKLHLAAEWRLLRSAAASDECVQRDGASHVISSPCHSAQGRSVSAWSLCCVRGPF